MKRYIWIVLAAALSFTAGLERSHAASGPTADNVINVTIAGAKSGTYRITGEKASATFAGFQDTRLKSFSLIFTTDAGVQMQTGATTLDLGSRSEQKGGGTARFSVNADNEKWQDTFNSQFYPLYFDATPDSSESATYITLHKVEKLKDGYLLLEGKFRFNAANSPQAEALPKAALDDALANSGRKPPYRSDLAGTTKIQAGGDFKVAVLVKPFGW